MRERRPSGRPTIATIGYEGAQLEGFLATLREAGVDEVVDVRYRPSSRKRGFSRTPLAAALAAAGIAYRHVRDLGTPPELRRARGEGLPWPEFARAYAEHLDGRTEALADLAALVRERRVALLCFEADAGTCHRALVADSLRDAGVVVTVRHLVVAAPGGAQAGGPTTGTARTIRR